MAVGAVYARTVFGSRCYLHIGFFICKKAKEKVL